MKSRLKWNKSILFWVVILFANISLQAQDWTWMKGSNIVNSYGAYGTQGTAAASNLPGSRESAYTWTDNNGNLWMYGGNGFCSTGYGKLSDLWKFDPSSNQWTWVNGPDAINQNANYGTMGTASVTNNPGSRSTGITWTDNSGNLWLFGGNGYDGSGNQGDQNDLWKYNIASNLWTWMGGTNLLNQNGIYGTQGVASSTNIPGARRASCAWKDNSGDLWLFGGYGYPATGGSISGLNDLWKYSISGNTWQWVSGSNAIDQTGVYGTQGAASALNTPGTRYGVTAWKDNSGKLWLFAGYGYGASTVGHLNDVWCYNISTGQWTWTKGSSYPFRVSVFGTQTVPSSLNTPGGRHYSCGWSDAAGNLYVYGGHGISTYSPSAQNLNDTWKYDITSNNWTFIRGASNEVVGNYGTQGVTASTNDPGSGYMKMRWKDNFGNFWLFGGNGYDVNGNYSVLGDLWKMNSCLPQAPVSISTYSNQNACSGVSATLSIVSNTNAVAWYTVSTGGTPVSTSTTYVTPALSSGTAASASFTYYAASTNTCGSSVRAPIIVTSNNVNPTVTTGPTHFTVTQYIGSGQTPNSSWSPWVYTFTDPLPAGAIITGVGLNCDGVDQGWGGTGAGADMRLAGQRVGIPIYSHSWQPFYVYNMDPFANYNYGGTNTFEMYFVGWSGWQGFINNATLTFSYQTKTPASITACQNSSLTLKAYGAVTYTWSGGIFDNVPFAASSTQIYTVTGANVYGCVNTATQLVNVTPSPTVAVTGNTAVCLGSSLTQTATVTGTSHTFSWSTGATTATISTSPTIHTTYIATASNTITGCSHSFKRKVLVNSIPTVTVATANATICSGQSTSLTVSSNTTAFGLFFDGVDDYIETNANITELGKADFSMEAWIKTAGVSEGIITCNNSDANWDQGEKCFYLDGFGVPNFVGWGNQYIVGISAVNDGAWHHVAVVWDYSSGIYGVGKIYVDGVDNTLSSSYQANYSNLGTFKIGMQNYNGYIPEAPNNFNGNIDDVRIWNTARTASQISSNINTCLTGTEYGIVAYYRFEDGTGSVNAADATLNDYNGILSNMSPSTNWIQGKPNCFTTVSSYSWMPGSLSTQTINVSPATSTDYSLTATNNYGCSAFATRSIMVNPSPTITVNSGSICPGNSFTIVPAGASLYSISGGTTVVSPTTTANYSITGISSAGCVSTNTAVSGVAVNALPVIAISGPTAVCSGAAVTQTASGANTYSWSTGATTATVSLNPTVSTSYIITGTNTVTGCVNSTSRFLTVGNTPFITVNSGNICEGQTFTLIPSGASTYTFANSSSTVPATVSPTVNTNYFVSGTSSLGCVSTASAISNVVVNAAPLISVNSGGICAGKVFTMTPSGASTYTFSNGSSTVSPLANTSYSVTGTTILGCVSLVPGIANVTVNAVPVVSAPNGTVCTGGTYSIVASGAQTYTYYSSAGQTSSLVTLSANTSYSVTGTSSAGCISSNTAAITVSTIALPVITVNSSTVCSGTVFTMTPGGASTYTYSNGSSTVTPFANTSYSVIGTSSVGCVSLIPAVANVTLLASPVVSVNNGAICAGQTFTIVPSGALTYSYSGNSATVSPVITSTYAVSGISFQGCPSSNTAIVTVAVNPAPQLSVSGTSAVCQGGSSNLLVTGASTFTWNTGANGPILVVSPSTTTNYTVNATNANGCTNYTTYLVAVNQLPTITVNSGSVCPSSSFTIMPSGALTYTYSGGTNVVSPAVTTSYSVFGTDGNGCTSINPAISTVSVNANLNLVVSGSTLVCAGSTVNLSASGANTYSWSTGAVTNSIAATPTSSTLYSVVGSDGSCFDSVFVTVQVNQLPVVQLKPVNGIICNGESLTLTASGALSYTWSTLSNTGIIVVTPSITTSYSVLGSDMNACENSAAITVTVNECLGIAANSGNSEELIQLYPNPNNGEFIITSVKTLKLVIRNNLGQLVMEKELLSGENQISLQDQAKGVYQVEISDSGFVKNMKVIKD